MDIFHYTISKVLSQLTSNSSSQLYLVVFFFRKMIFAETRYKTYNRELLAIVEVFKT